jgi:hypothetical protein
MLKSAFTAQGLRVIIVMNDETLTNLIKRKHPSKEEKKKQSARTCVQSCKRAPKSEPHRGKGTTEYRNLHRWHEAYQLKKGEVDLIIIVSCTGRSNEIYVAIVERRSGKRKDRMKLSLSSKLVGKLVWVPILWLCKIFILNYSFMFDALLGWNWPVSALII